MRRQKEMGLVIIIYCKYFLWCLYLISECFEVKYQRQFCSSLRSTQSLSPSQTQTLEMHFLDGSIHLNSLGSHGLSEPVGREDVKSLSFRIYKHYSFNSYEIYHKKLRQSCPGSHRFCRRHSNSLCKFCRFGKEIRRDHIEQLFASE